MRKFKVREMTTTALMTALLCATAPFTIPMGAVPLSLASFIIYLAAALLGARKGCLCVWLYLLLGTIGLPVFSGFSGSPGKIVGPTGGYMLGYLFCALVVGLASDLWGERFLSYPLSMVIGTILLYALGTIWFMVQSKSSLILALSLCVFPFLIGDAIKIMAAAGLGFTLRRRLSSILSKE